jgi:hypothetical protein
MQQLLAVCYSPGRGPTSARRLLDILRVRSVLYGPDCTARDPQTPYKQLEELLCPPSLLSFRFLYLELPIVQVVAHLMRD